jgi:hypothetical protein
LHFLQVIMRYEYLAKILEALQELHLPSATATVLAEEQAAGQDQAAVQVAAVAAVAPLYCLKMAAWPVCQQVAAVAQALEFQAMSHQTHPVSLAKPIQDIPDKMVKTIQVMAVVVVVVAVAGTE